MTARQTAALGGVLGALGVGLGAFGAHALKSRLGVEDLQIFETAVRYQMYHAVALIGVAAWAARHPSPKLALAARLFGLGILIFSGSLYLLVGTGIRWMGAITPFGGVALIGGWIALTLGALERTGDG